MRCALCLKKRNKKWVWLAVGRATQDIKGFYVGSRGTSSFKQLSKKIKNIDAKIYATDDWKSYDFAYQVYQFQ